MQVIEILYDLSRLNHYIYESTPISRLAVILRITHY